MSVFMESQHPAATAQQSSDSSLNELLATVIESKKVIAATVLAMAFIGLIHIFLSEPVYRSDALIQIKQQGLGVGSISDFTGLSDLFEGSTLDSEVEILSSRSVLAKVVQEHRLDISATPLYFPFAGKQLARRLNIPHDTSKDAGSAESSWLQQVTTGSKYAWGKESIVVDEFNVPKEYIGTTFTLVTEKNGRYKLYDDQERLLLLGKTGETEESSALGAETLSLYVRELNAGPGTHFEISRKQSLSAIESLRRKLIIDSLENNERLSRDLAGTGLVRLALSGKDPVMASAVLNSIVNTYQQVNIDRKTSNADKALELLHGQMDALKVQTENSESSLNEFRLEKGTVDLNQETQALIERSVALETQLSTLRQERVELLQRFTQRHHQVAALDAQIASIRGEIEKIESSLRTLPETEQQIVSLTRTQEVNSQLYSLLLGKVNELEVIKAGTVGNVNVLDPAVPPVKPFKPRRSLMLAIYLMLGLLSGVAIIFLRKVVHNYVEDPDIIERKLGLPVYAVVPHSEKQAMLNDRKSSSQRKSSLLTSIIPDDRAIECIRSLRTSLQPSLLESKNNVLLITGPAPGVGKSFLSINLGALLAVSGKRVLVIDADLRNGHMHEYFHIRRSGGLSEILWDRISVNKAVQATGLEGLFMITTGTLPLNPSEMLTGDKFKSLLDKVSADFDHVILDSPPVLPVTDAAIIGRLAGATLLVLKANQHHLREVEQCVKQLRQSGANLRGAVFNDMDTSAARYGYGRYYGHAYSYTSSAS